MPHAMERLELAGRDLAVYLSRLLRERGYSFCSPGRYKVEHAQRITGAEKTFEYGHLSQYMIRIVCATKLVHVFISLPINLNRCFGCSKEPSH